MSATAPLLASNRLGLVVPGDSGVPAGLTQTYYKAFAPRVGLAYSPNFTGHWETLANGKTSIRSGWGLFYNPMEQLVLEQFGAEPPFGGSTYLPSHFLKYSFHLANRYRKPEPVQRNTQPRTRHTSGLG